MSANRLLVAAAGSGKTSLIIREVMQTPHEKILITTFTLANEQSIRQRLIKANNGTVPANVTIQPWFSFLLEHGVRPYRFWDRRVDGLKLVQQASGLRYMMKNGTPVYWKEADNFFKHYFNENMDVYSDKLAKLACNCNGKSGGKVISRLEKIYTQIYIDEVQDMAGWDLEIIKLLLKSSIRLTMVGDPRQTVYHTHVERKHDKYSDGKIREFVRTECKKLCDVDEQTLKDSYRNSAPICAVSSKLYSGEFIECNSRSSRAHDHTGIFFVRERDLEAYGSRFSVLQLRFSAAKKAVLASLPVMTFGDSKGLEADHVIIYPTKDMLKWLNGGQVSFAFTTKTKLYVALTRAFFSVGVVVDNKFKNTSQCIGFWEP